MFGMGGKMENKKPYKAEGIMKCINTLSPRYDSSEECRASYLLSGGSYYE